VGTAGPAAAFLLNAASLLGMLRAIYRWRPGQAARDVPPEDMLGASVAGMRYVRDAPALKAVLVRIGAFTLGASALWSLLPVVARRELGLDPTGYGIVLGSLGAGAVCGVLLLPRLRQVLSLDHLTAAATLVFAGATLAAAHLRFAPLVVLTTAAGGLAWLTVMSCVGFAAQVAVPAWVRARALSVYLLVFQGLRPAIRHGHRPHCGRCGPGRGGGGDRALAAAPGPAPRSELLRALAPTQGGDYT
jgi:predicted MFS family arabinose efflux permease